MDLIDFAREWAWVPVVAFVAYELVMWPIRYWRQRERRRAREAARLRGI